MTLRQLVQHFSADCTDPSEMMGTLEVDADLVGVRGEIALAHVSSSINVQVQLTRDDWANGPAMTGGSNTRSIIPRASIHQH